MFKKNQKVILEITDITHLGQGVGRIDGLVFFVEGAAIGDVIEAQILKIGKNIIYAKLINILTPSPDRIAAACSSFEKCGGCSYLHINYEAEFTLKVSQTLQNFQRIGGVTFSDIIEVPAESRSNYRNKCAYPVSRDRNGRLLIGFYAGRSHRVIDNRSCMLQPEIFGRIIEKIADFIDKYEIPVYDEESHTGLIRHIYLRQAAITKELMVCLVINGNKLPHDNILVEMLGSSFPQIVSLMLNVNTKKTNVILGKECNILFGKDSITDILLDKKFKIGPLSFYQVNPVMAAKLYGVVKDWLELSGTECVVDLYCGIGAIGICISDDLGELIGIEIVPQAVVNAKENAELNNVSKARFICSDATDFSEELKNIHAVILDPPRAGCDKTALDYVLKLSPKHIAMVSCNSATAARDVKYLVEMGFEAKRLAVVDMFPGSTHVETCVLLSHKNS